MDILKYLGLPPDYQPNPESDPILFLSHNIRIIPKHFSQKFAQSTTPKQRTVIPAIRNRRTKFTQSNPTELSFESAKNTWPLLWAGDPSEGGPRRGGAEGLEEKNWADREFLGGAKQHIGKLGNLLGGYEEERTAEKFRMERRRREVEEPFVPEEDTSDEDLAPAPLEESPEEARLAFERLVRERFIYGLLDSDLYATVDWDDMWDEETSRDDEDRWFEDEDES
ncbi:hypothetical protein BDM02DRAFT_3110943 [Thelephora ganbajun]|uniref:Uncharacterized protein n=1 Tax=Thelephora ganbajun TaxID=370292 RepID=A0ACB6ZNT0_THEGA|nr:hypothetical protein BDM02DRAFT_3110943 [Thelephora ganbajun]